MSDEEIVQTGKEFGYGNWLQPIINANDNSEMPPVNSASSSQVSHRGRGRPRVQKVRDQSAIEKRRAQVREAQRTYQKRKDTATATEKRRADELLLVLSDLSADVESLLQAASKSGTMYAQDDVAKKIQSLWHTYDTAINTPCVQPELRLQLLKNGQRQAQHRTDSQFMVVPPPSDGENPASAVTSEAMSFRRKPIPFHFDRLNFELQGTNDGAENIESMIKIGNPRMTGRSIFDIAKERQAAMREEDARLRGG